MGKGEGIGTNMVALAAFGGVAGAVLKKLDEKHFIFKDVRLLSQLGVLGANIQKNMLTGWTIATGLEEAAEKFHGKEAIVMVDGLSYSFQDWNDYANAAARFFHKLGVRKGDVVAVYMENRPEFLFTFCGLAKLGAVAALINNNLKKKGLLHCLKVSGANILFMGSECIENIEESEAEIRAAGFSIHCEGPNPPSWADSTTERFAGHSKAAVPPSWRKGARHDDDALLIYTSGTTSLPKASKLKHAKLYGAGVAFGIQFGISGSDRIYNAGLPLYHSAATNIGAGLCIVNGCTLVIRRKFSASSYFEDCAKYNCSVAQYIGELCRYLLKTPPGKYDKAHKLRICVGNGLRPEIWDEFQTRFNIPEIGEFYGSSEGNLALFNHSRDKRSRGAIGHMGTLYRQLGFCTIVKFDAEKEEIIRDEKGFCIECEDGEVGEAIAEIKDRPAGTFDGYHGDTEQTEKKILTDVFKKGDRYFRSGDLLSKDELGYYYFVDRIGDTFRYRGENVSTTEVAGIVGGCPGVVQANVYGVQIPGKDGRMCCAAITYEHDNLNLDAIQRTCESELPSYAQPLFIRLLPEMEQTGTFKVQKVALRNEGVDPTVVRDQLYFLDENAEGGKRFVPLDMDVWNRIVTGQSRL